MVTPSTLVRFTTNIEALTQAEVLGVKLQKSKGEWIDLWRLCPVHGIDPRSEIDRLLSPYTDLALELISRGYKDVFITDRVSMWGKSDTNTLVYRRKRNPKDDEVLDLIREELDIMGTRVAGLFDVAFPGEDRADGIGVELTLPESYHKRVHHTRLYGPDSLGASVQAMRGLSRGDRRW